jgi:hypothetical protein
MAAALSLHALAFRGSQFALASSVLALSSGIRAPANPALGARRSFFQQAGVAEIATTTIDAGGKRGAPLRCEHRFGADS